MKIRRIYTIGYRAGLFAMLCTIGYDLVQLLQVVRLLSFPLDEILIYGFALGIVVPFLLLLLSLHFCFCGVQRFWTHGALLFATLYALFVSANYGVQLTVVMPAKQAGTVKAVQILDQSPHSLFWCFDALGYICMGLAALLLLPLFQGTPELRGVRNSLRAHVLVTPLIAVVYFYPVYTPSLLWLGFPWAITAPWFMLSLARYMGTKRALVR